MMDCGRHTSREHCQQGVQVNPRPGPLSLQGVMAQACRLLMLMALPNSWKSSLSGFSCHIWKFESEISTTRCVTAAYPCIWTYCTAIALPDHAPGACSTRPRFTDSTTGTFTHVGLVCQLQPLTPPCGFRHAPVLVRGRSSGSGIWKVLSKPVHPCT